MTIQTSIQTGINTGVSTGILDGGGIIPGLVLWLDASNESSVILNGADVSQWSDLSGNANHATQGSAALQPLYVPPTETVPGTLTFDGGNVLIIADSPTMRVGAEFSLFAVYDQVTDAAVFRTLIKAGTSGSPIEILMFLQAFGFLATALPAPIEGANFPPEPTLISVGKTSGVVPVFKVKGPTSVLAGFTTSDNSDSTEDWAIGRQASGGSFWDGDISEILIYNRKLNDVEFDRVHNSLGVKYGLSETTIGPLP